MNKKKNKNIDSKVKEKKEKNTKLKRLKESKVVDASIEEEKN